MYVDNFMDKARFFITIFLNCYSLYFVIQTKKALIKSEELSKELGDLNNNLQEKVLEATKELYESSSDLKKKNKLLKSVMNRMKEEIKHRKLLEESELKHKESIEYNILLEKGLTKLDYAIRGEKDIKSISTLSLEIIIEYLEAQFGAIYISENDKLLKCQSSYSYPTINNESSVYNIGQGIIGEAALSKKTIVTSINDVNKAVLFGIGAVSPEQIIHVPLLNQEEVIGVIEIGKLNLITEEQMNWLYSAVYMISASVKMAKDNEELQDLMNKLSIKEELSRQILESTGEGMYGVDDNGKITFINPVACDILGYAQQELLGKYEHEIFHHSFKDGSKYPEDKCPIKSSYKNGTVNQIDNEVFWRKDGKSFPIEYLATPIKEMEKIVGSVVSFRDISKKLESEKQIRISEMRLKIATESAGIASWEWYLENNIFHFSEKYKEILGYSSDEEMDLEIWKSYIHPDDVEKVNKFLDDLLTGKVEYYRNEYRLMNKEKSEYIWVMDFGKTVEYNKDGLPSYVIGVVYDNTERKEFELEIQQQGENLQEIFDISPIGVAVGANRKIEMINPALKNLIGAEVGDESKLYYADSDLYETILGKILKTGSVENLEMQLRHQNGEIIDVLANLKEIEYNGNRAVLAWFVDIRERKQFEMKIKNHGEKLQEIFDISPVAASISVDGEVVMTNSALITLLGIDIGDSMLLCYVDEKVRQDVLEKVKVYGEIENYELQMRHRNGQNVDAIANYREIEYNGARAVLAWFIDITERKSAEKEIIIAKNEAEAASKAKADFLAVMSHEIRTPMNAIIGMTYLIGKTELTQRQKEYIGKIQNSSQHLLGIINDILDFSKVESGKLEVEAVEFKLESVMNTLSNLVVDKANAKGLEIIFDIENSVPDDLIGDPLRIGQILINYVNNAIKFTEKGEIRVAIKIETKSERGVLLKFSVSDTGIGIGDEQKDRLFQGFQQGDTSITRKYGGTGLGLAISKKLALLMGGDAGFESKLGEGSTFWFTAWLGYRERTKYSKIIKEDLKGKRVLVVDDNPSAKEVLVYLLSEMGFNVDKCSSGQEALNMIFEASQNEAYKIIFADCQMPVMDGFETGKRILEAQLQDPPKLILLTSCGGDDIFIKAEKIGFDQVIIKPIKHSLLFATIMRILSVEAYEAAAEQAQQMPANDNEALMTIKSSRILIVEDNEMNQEVAQAILQEAGFFTDIADNGKIAVEMVQNSAYDLVLMDMEMPVMGGIEATRAIRKLGGYEDLPVIAVTANVMQSDQELCTNSGMNDYITKPLDLSELWRILIKWIKPKDLSLDSYNIVEAIDEDIDGFQNIEEIDLNLALKRLSDKKDLYLKIIKRFVASQSEAAVEIKEIIAKGDYETVARSIHSLKGLLGNIGAVKMQEVAMEIEQKFHKEIPLEDFHNQLNEFLNRLEDLNDRIKKELPEEKDKGLLSDDSIVDYYKIIKKLVKLLEDNNPLAVRFFEENIKSFKHFLDKDFMAVSQYIRSFDFDEVILILKKY